MNLEIFSVYDAKAKAFIMPFYTINSDIAIRSFSECACDASHAFSRSPSDYILHHLGVFDSGTGCLFPLPQSVVIGSAAAFRAAFLDSESLPFDFMGNNIKESGHE